MPWHPDNLRAKRPSGAGYQALAVFALGVALFATGCPANQEWIASKCKACANDKECPGGQHCIKGTCSAKKACKSDNDCPQDEDCVNGYCSKEKAAAPPPAQCTLDAVFFDFNESAL